MEWTELISLAAAIVAAVAAVAVLFRQRGSTAGKLFAVGMVLFAAEAIIDFQSRRQIKIEEMLRWQELRYVPVALLPFSWITFSLVYSRGNYRDHLRNRSKLLVLVAIAPIVTLIAASKQLLSLDYATLMVQFGIGAQALEFILIGGAILVLMNLEQTFRSSVGTQRWKIKLILLGVGGLFLVRIYTGCQLVILSAPDESMASLNSAMLILTCVLVGFSVVRTKDFSIDLYPSQTALQRSVIVILIGIYFVIIGLLTKLATFLGGDTNFQLRALVILVGLVGLASLLMSDRLQKRSRAWITRHFSRPHYNYRQVWTSFKRDTAALPTTEELCPAIAKWVSKTVNALSVTVWLVDGPRRNLKLAGSTLDPDQTLPTKDTVDSSTWTIAVQSAIHLERMVNLDRAQGDPVESLSHLQPKVFPNGGNRFAVPLKASKGNIGVIVVGDRVDGVPMTSEDEELLSTVAEQASLEIQAINLSQELMQSREMEAFQNMSTFFVHDLKNTASSLSLMLQNLPKHFENPDFREDALRSIKRSVDRINEIILSLSALRRKLVVNPVRVDLSQTLFETVSSLADERGIHLEKNFLSAGPVNIDVEQIGRVVTNLIVNAHEASPAEKSIKIATGKQDGFAFLEVSDHGAGMSEQFIQTRLFRPFQTTKKSGTGIGLYHSKMIVDAHRGRVEVQSEPGVGTTFRVLLPLLVPSDEA